MSGASVGLLENIDFLVVIASKYFTSTCSCVSNDITHECLTGSSFHTITTLVRFVAL
jgi:hypothetical protein